MKNWLILYILFFFFVTPHDICSQVQYRETVWLQLDRDLYLAGEEIFFRVELLENDTYKPSELSKSILLELFDSQGNNIKRSNLTLEGSELAGSIDIPANLKTGWYYLRGYTTWMRNFGEKYYTVRAIRVYNPEDKTYKAGQAGGRLHLDIRPFIETASGKPVCSVHATDSYGTGIEAHGFILSGPVDTVLYFKTDNTGWAYSYYNAGNADRYQAFAENFPKDSIEFNVLNIRDSDDDPEISLTERYGYIIVDMNKVQDNTEYRMLIHRLYSSSWYNSGRPVNGMLSFRVPLKDIPSGISQITILDEENNEIFRRLWSDYSESLSSIRIEGREQNINIGTDAIFNYVAPLNLNILVHSLTPRPDIYNFLPGLPGWPALSEIPSSDETFRAWLASNTYAEGTAAAFFHDNLQYPVPPSFNNNGDEGIRYYPDTRPGIIRGRIFDNENKPLALKSIAMAILNDNLFSAARTDQQGFFAFTFPGLHGSKDYLANYYNDYKPTWKLQIEDPFDDIKSLPERGRPDFTVEEMEYLNKQGLLLQLNDIYNEHDSTLVEPVIDSQTGEPMFYGKPDFSIEVDDYIKLPNLREVFLEVVPFVAVRQRDGRNRLLLTGDNLLSDNFPALVLLDRIPLYEYDDLLNLPPERITRIEGINDFYVHGNVVLSGIVSIYSKNGDFAGLKIPRSAIISSIQLSDTVTYEVPDRYPVPGKGYPVIENIPLWNKLETSQGNTVTVKMNDYPGRHAISIYGFDSEGRWYRGVKLFNVF